MISMASALGGVAPGWQGNIYVRIPTKDEPEKFWIVSFYFSSLTELADLVKQIKDKGWQPFTDVIDLKVSGHSLPQPDVEQEEACPLHGTRFIKPSKKRPGSLFCGAKVGDHYCNWESG